MTTRSTSRRNFLRKMAASSAFAAVGTKALAQNVFQLERAYDFPGKVAPNDKIRIGLVGAGIIGFIDTDTALRVPGVELVAAADVYKSRQTRIKEVYGANVNTYTDYRDMLEHDDIDAVLLCVPDHWHTQMSIDAMKAGKAVYCEKPMTRTVAEGPEVIKTMKETGAVFQVGSQFGSDILYDKAKELYESGAIGKLNSVEAKTNRNTAMGAWHYSIPPHASPEEIDWDLFLGSAPKRPFEPIRLFRWRNYWDYGTAVAGDIYVHLFTGIHKTLNSLGPTTIMATAGNRYWNHDERESYDVIFGLFDYPETEAHPGFTLSLQTNFVDGSGGGQVFRFIGSDGAIEVGFTDLKLKQVGLEQENETPEERVLYGYNSVRTWATADQKVFEEKWRAGLPGPKVAPAMAGESTFVAPPGYDARFDHFANFFDSVRNSTPVYEDAIVGHRAAAPANLCNDSYRQGKIMKWDPVDMKEVG